MKLLLTSGGIRNNTIQSALQELVGKPFHKAKLCFIPTASVAEGGDHQWFVDDLNRIRELGWQEFDVLDLRIPKPLALKRLEHADVIYVEGGDTYYLAKSIADNDLGKNLLKLLDSKVYVGVSAGSMIFSKDFTKRLTAFYGEDDETYQLNSKENISPLNVFDWFVKPHVDFAVWQKEVKDFPYYAIDDQTAIKIIDGKIDVVSEGKWRLVNHDQ